MRALVEPLVRFSWPGALALAPGALSLPVLVQLDWRVALEAAAPETSSASGRAEVELLGAVLVEPDAELLLGAVRVEPGAELLVDGLVSLLVRGELWAKAAVATPAIRAATAQSVVMVRIGSPSLRPQPPLELAAARSVRPEVDHSVVSAAVGRGRRSLRRGGPSRRLVVAASRRG